MTEAKLKYETPRLKEFGTARDVLQSDDTSALMKAAQQLAEDSNPAQTR